MILLKWPIIEISGRTFHKFPKCARLDPVAIRTFQDPENRGPGRNGIKFANRLKCLLVTTSPHFQVSGRMVAIFKPHVSR